jgi:glycosyltransferase involved in cell wall biosynthesis
MITALPKVLLLIDTKNWAFATIAQALVTHLSSQFSFDILATEDRPVFDEGQYDIIHVFFETETYHLPFLSGHAKVVKSVYSHYWELNGETPEEFYKKHLGEADCITVPSLKLLRSLSVLPVPVALFPESIDTHLFQPEHKPREGALVVGWAGNATRPIKRLDWLRSACDSICTLRIADGHLSKEEMVDFYNSIDVIACSSRGEGGPCPILEGMSCGAFPVSFDVGIVQEVVESGVNGLIVEDVSVAGLRTALRWCAKHLEEVRAQSYQNTGIMRRHRDFSQTCERMARVYSSLL